MKQQIKYFALLDILGFKDIVNNNKLCVVEGLYNTLTEIIGYGKAFHGIKHWLPNFQEIEGKTCLNSLFVSDSIMLWTDNDEPNGFFELILVVQHIMNLSIERGMPLRGAITSGEIVVKTDRLYKSGKLESNNSILGLPLINAYLLEKKAEWSGCIIDDETIFHYSQKCDSWQESESFLPNLNTLIHRNIIKRYNVPMKKGSTEELYSINWTHINRLRLNEDILERSFKKHNKNIEHPRVQDKIRNTINYFKETKMD